MKYLLSISSKFFEPKSNFKLNKVIASLTKYFKKLVALSLLATLAITIAACDGQKTKTKTKAKSTKTQLETLGIDASKAFFVTPSGKKTNDGSSWQKAMDLQSAIDAAATDATKEFVLVAEGSYSPDPEKKDPNKTFILKDGVKIYGGFDPSDINKTRDFKASILDGSNRVTRSKQILTGTNLSATSILDGFLIQNALNTDDWVKGGALFLNNSKLQLNNLTFNDNKLTGKNSTGAAIYNTNSSPSISNSSFSNNSAYGGGAIYNYNSSPSISNSSFSNNSANFNGGAFYNHYSNTIISNSSFNNNSAVDGGAIYNGDLSSPSISNSSFSYNSATNYGGAISINYESNPSISNSSFSNNFATNYGGAISINYKSNPSISNSSFSNNSAGNYGGAIFNKNNSDPKIYNSIFWDNKDKHRGVKAINNIYNRDVADQPIIKNSILNENSAVTKTSSGYNPQDYKQTKAYDFLDFNDAKFKDNQAPATFSIDVRGKVASANQDLIKDKGDNALYKEVTKKEASSHKDLAGNPRLKGSKIDIGAYEIQD